MWKEKSLAMKIGMSFGAIFIIAIVLGMIAVLNVKIIQKTANIIIKENVPEVELVNNIDHWFFWTNLNMRGYVYTGDETFLADARQDMQKVKDYLRIAQERGANSPHLGTFNESMQKIEESIGVYEQLMNETVGLTKELEDYRMIAASAGKSYRDIYYKFLTKKEQQIKEDLDQPTIDKAEITLQLKQISLVNELIDISNQTIIGTWK
jgi:CHASE3 domain sensor protein